LVIAEICRIFALSFGHMTWAQAGRSDFWG